MLNDVKQPTPSNRGWKLPIGVFSLLLMLLIVSLLAACGSEAVTPPVSTSEGQSTPEPAEQSPEEEAALANPDSAEAQFELGNYHARNQQWAEATDAYLKTIELDPDYQAAYANLGVAYYQQESFDLAATQYEKALELDPADGDVSYNLGALYLQQALTNESGPDAALLQQAIDQLNEARDLSPDLAEPYFSLGVAYGTLGQTQEAVTAFETFLEQETGQDPRARQEAERYLQQLLNSQ